MCQVLLVAGLLTDTASAANDPFVGQWKLNPSRSKLNDEMKVTEVGENTYTFDFGGGNPETVVVNGTDQPGFDGSTLAVAVEGPNWKVIRKKDDHILITAVWTLSKDGSSLIDDYTSFGQDGSPAKVKFVYTRTAGGGTGFSGDWVSTSEVVNSVVTLQISPYESDGLSFTGSGATTNVNFDGKSARRLNANALERTLSYGGKVIQTREYKLSSDLKTLTMTARTVGHTVPNIFVFERQ
jgi:hypothetical protein